MAEYASGTQPFYVVSDNPSSMSPTIGYGSAVVVYRPSFSAVSGGDVIVFHDPRGNPVTVIHRVLSVGDCGGERCLVTKGDNNATNPTPDPWNVTQQYYAGKVLLIVPFAGYVSPALWGFSGLSALLPISFVSLLVILLGAMRTRSTELTGPPEEKSGGE